MSGFGANLIICVSVNTLIEIDEISEYLNRKL